MTSTELVNSRINSYFAVGDGCLPLVEDLVEFTSSSQRNSSYVLTIPTTLIFSSVSLTHCSVTLINHGWENQHQTLSLCGIIIIHIIVIIYFLLQ